ncbi:MFS transporter [Xenorhabdus sp. 12]|uniref:MFS transporter n=1 Tax=Xenorhabdus santafensis TaxID=2582833 RepID=A0ABU4SB62_9GAMM|nr:hypothetical protein [Xenorhabdus sp. 12]MDX7988014.1 MFS transporter [Xenorhabdus sp. 12]
MGQGIAIPLAFNTILGSVKDDMAGMASGALSTLQIVGTSTGVTIVGTILFSVLSTSSADNTTEQAYGYALAIATIYNSLASLISLFLFSYATRAATSPNGLQRM